jgi:hypothetical protein
MRFHSIYRIFPSKIRRIVTEHPDTPRVPHRQAGDPTATHRAACMAISHQSYTNIFGVHLV